MKDVTVSFYEKNIINDGLLLLLYTTCYRKVVVASVSMKVLMSNWRNSIEN